MSSSHKLVPHRTVVAGAGERPIIDNNHLVLGPIGVDNRPSIASGSHFTVPSGLGGSFNLVPTPTRAADGRQVFRATNPDFEAVHIAYSPAQLADEVLQANEHRPRHAATYGSLPEMIAIDNHHEAKATTIANCLRSIEAGTPPAAPAAKPTA